MKNPTTCFQIITQKTQKQHITPKNPKTANKQEKGKRDANGNIVLTIADDFTNCGTRVESVLDEDGTVTEPAESDKASATEELIDIGEEESNGYQPLVNDPKLYEALEEAEVWGDKSENGENKNI